MDNDADTPAPQDSPATPEGERIAKVLSRAGIASRRDAERLVVEGRVAVNGAVLDSPAHNVTPADRITVDGVEVGKPEATRLWLYHKPAGLVTTESDEEGRPTVFDDLPDDLPRVMTIGRLDLTSEGLLLLTNDGAIKRRLELPSTGWTRRYRVRVHGTPTDAQLDPLRRGVTVDGMDYQPMDVNLDRQQGSNAWLTVVLREGKNREIRRAMEHVGLTVNRLIRTGYGPFALGELASGEVEEVRPKVVRDQLGLDAPKPARLRQRAEAAPEAPAEPREPRDTLATPRPEGATAKRELKPRTPKDRTAKPARRPFEKDRTWIRPDTRPPRDRGDEESRPRSQGYRSQRDEGAAGEAPRSRGFRSHGDGDRPARPYRPREDGDRPARSYKPRAEGDRPARPYAPRHQDGDRPARPYRPREDGDRPARPYKPRAEGDRPARAYKPRAEGDRPYRPREDGDRPARPYRPREEGDRSARPYRPREDGDRPQRGFKPRGDGPPRKGPARGGAPSRPGGPKPRKG